MGKYYIHTLFIIEKIVCIVINFLKRTSITLLIITFHCINISEIHNQCPSITLNQRQKPLEQLNILNNDINTLCNIQYLIICQ